MGREHWAETVLENICSITTGKRDVNEGNPNGKYLFFTCAQHPTRIDFFEFEGEAILVAGNGFFNVKYYTGQFNAYQRTYVLQNINIHPKLLYYFIQYSLDLLTKDKRGTTIKYIRLPDLQKHVIPLPPLNEQQRIVDKLDAILPKVKRSKVQLENISRIKEKLAYSYAIENGEFSKEVELGEYIYECNDRVGDGWGKFPMVGVDQQKGIVPLRTSKAKGFENYKVVRKGNFVYNPMRINVGSIAFYNKDEVAITSPDYVVFSTADDLSPNYLLTYLKSKKGLMQIDNNTQGAVRERLYFENLCKVKINESVVGKTQLIENTFKAFNKLESNKNYLLTTLEKIEKSILAKAFRGELVEPDPNDESAEELFKRILQEKAKLEGTRKRVGRGRSSQNAKSVTEE